MHFKNNNTLFAVLPLGNKNKMVFYFVFRSLIRTFAPKLCGI